MILSEISIGDRVRYNGSFTGEGTVVDILQDDGLSPYLCCIGVDFGSDKPSAYGHRLRGSVGYSSRYNIELPKPTGWWCEPICLELIQNDTDSLAVTSISVLEFLGAEVSK